MLGIRIPVMLDPDLFKQIRNTMILHLWIRYDRSFQTADFQTENSLM
jgi:hypothetical protein